MKDFLTNKVNLSGFVIAITILLTTCVNENKLNHAPKAKKMKKELEIHGNVRIDNYYWLNDRENPEVIKYLERENAYTKARLKHTEVLQEKLFDEIISRLDPDKETVPYKRNGYFYYSKYEKGKEYPVYCRKKENLEASEEIILDVNLLAEGYNYYSIKSLQVSPDNKNLLFGVDTLSRRKYQIFLKNLEDNTIKDLDIRNTTGSTVWANNSKTFFYTVKDSTLKPYKICKHNLNGGDKEDQIIFEEKEKAFMVYASKSKSEKYIILNSMSTGSEEYRLIDADNPDKPYKLFNERQPDLEYKIAHHKDHFYILTNYKATNFRLMKTALEKTGIENWVEVIAENEEIFMEDLVVLKDFLVIKERKKGLMNFEVLNLKTEEKDEITFNEPAFTLYFSDNFDNNSNIFRFQYTSLTTPKSVYDYNLTGKKRVLLKRDKVIGDFNPENYVTERLFATAADGVEIPVSIVYRKGFRNNGESPVFIKGYGSYGNSYDPTFRPMYLSLLDRGFVYAIAHVRGGQEMGRAWYDNGKLLKKKNTFTDFISCCEYLIKENYTSSDKLYAYGGSAGGLLMGAIINMKPDIFGGVIAAVPFVDVVTTMLDESIPLTTGEYNEWGNPNEKLYYDYMLSYSPYDNVKKQNYPPLLVTTGLHDSQVQYWEPAKWVAKLREYKTDDNQLLLHTNMAAGHGGASGRYEQYREYALWFAFVLQLAEINE